MLFLSLLVSLVAGWSETLGGNEFQKIFSALCTHSSCKFWLISLPQFRSKYLIAFSPSCFVRMIHGGEVVATTCTELEVLTRSPESSFHYISSKKITQNFMHSQLSVHKALRRRSQALIKIWENLCTNYRVNDGACWRIIK